MRIAIATYFMNRKWLDHMKAKANRARYREAGFTRETLSEYFIRKNELLTIVYNLDNSEIIMEIRDGVEIRVDEHRQSGSGD